MRRLGLWLMAAAVIPAAVAWGWHAKGHETVSRAAVEALPEEMPAFFRQGGALIAHTALDNDAFTRPIAPRELHASEAPEHYFDVELLEGQPIPPTRQDLLKLCMDKKLDPSKVGMLPYALLEWTQRLTVAFAEHRAWPDDPHIRTKCLVYAGLLSHYAADSAQPLHTTIHYDGRVGADGKSPRSGIHARVDQVLQKAEATRNAPAARVQAFENLAQAIREQIAASNGCVEAVYRLEGQLPAMDAPLPADAREVQRFAQGRFCAARDFAASLMLTAWRDSARISLPAWHTRPPTTFPAK